MKKIILLLTILTLSVTNLFSQGDCPSSATQINLCGQAFTLNNGGNTDCNPDDCGGACPQCVGPKNNSNFDGDCTTEAPSTNCGCDLGGSIENNVWFYFCPTVSCDYDIDITVSNCNSTSGMQYAVYGWNPPGSITNFYDEEGSGGVYYNNTTSNTYGFTAGECVYIMLDGFGGTVCDVALTVNPTAGCGGCTILAYTPDSFKTKYIKKTNITEIEFYTEGDNNNTYIIEKSLDGINYEMIEGDIEEQTEKQLHHYIDNRPSFGYNYYKLTQISQFGLSEVIGEDVIFVPNNSTPYRVYTVLGEEIKDISKYNGILMYIYEDGTVEKIIK
jgi:hypothetical protein